MATNPEELFPAPKAETPEVASTAQAVKAPTTINPEVASATQPAIEPPKPTELFPTSNVTAQPPAPPTPAPTVSTGGTTTAGPFQQEDKTFSPYISQVDKSTETVQGQLKDLFAEGNPLLVQARNRAAAAAAGRGLQNSSLATGAAQLAQMNAAMPIAQQDAATYSQRAMQNAQTINEFRTAEMSYYQELGKLKEQGNINAYMAGLQAGFDQDLAKLNGQIAKDQANLDHANRLLQMAAQGDIDSRLMTEKYGFDSKLSAQENLQRLEQLAVQGDINAKLQLQQFNFDSLLKDQEAGIALRLEDQRFQNNQNLLLVEYEQRGILSAQDAEAQMERLNQQHQNTLEQIAAQAEATGSVADKDRSAQLQGQYLSAVAARQASASAEITQIYTTEKLSAAQQNTAVANAYSRLDSDLKALAAYYAQSPLWPTNQEPAPTFDPLNPNYPGPPPASWGTTPTTGTNASIAPVTTAPTAATPALIPAPTGRLSRLTWPQYRDYYGYK